VGSGVIFMASSCSVHHDTIFCFFEDLLARTFAKFSVNCRLQPSRTPYRGAQLTAAADNSCNTEAHAENFHVEFTQWHMVVICI